MNENHPASSPWRAALTAPPVHIPARILIAEDDTELRLALSTALRRDGHDVLEVIDGGRLLVLLAQEYTATSEPRAVDLLVSDVRMPVCSGIQIVEQLRAAHWPTPVILMTAFGDDATRLHADALGAVLLYKPFDLDDFRTAIGSLLRRTS